MLYQKRGSIYRTILAIFIGFAFCFALAWPQYAKHRNAQRLNEAAELARALAFAEGSYKQRHGIYTPDFGQLNVPLPCPLINNGQGPHLDCHDYTFHWQPEQIIRAAHKHLPVWVEADVAHGTVQCHYSENDWAGQDLCARMQ